MQPTQLPITRREIQILDLVIGGRTSSLIATELGISKHTVDNHRKNILRRNTAELLQWCMTNGMINGGSSQVRPHPPEAPTG